MIPLQSLHKTTTPSFRHSPGVGAVVGLTVVAVTSALLLTAIVLLVFSLATD